MGVFLVVAIGESNSPSRPTRRTVVRFLVWELNWTQKADKVEGHFRQPICARNLYDCPLSNGSSGRLFD